MIMYTKRTLIGNKRYRNSDEWNFLWKYTGGGYPVNYLGTSY